MYSFKGQARRERGGLYAAASFFWPSRSPNPLVSSDPGSPHLRTLGPSGSRAVPVRSCLPVSGPLRAPRLPGQGRGRSPAVNTGGGAPGTSEVRAVCRVRVPRRQRQSAPWGLRGHHQDPASARLLPIPSCAPQPPAQRATRRLCPGASAGRSVQNLGNPGVRLETPHGGRTWSPRANAEDARRFQASVYWGFCSGHSETRRGREGEGWSPRWDLGRSGRNSGL